MAASTCQAVLLTGAAGTPAFPVDQSITQLPAPGATSATGNSGTGSAFTAAQTVIIEQTYVNGAGETTPGPQQTVTITTTGNNVVVTLPTFPYGVTGMSVYASTSNGSSTLYKVTAGAGATSTTSGGTVTITGFAPNTNSVPPASNTATVTPVSLLFNQADDNSTTTSPIVVPSATGTAFSYEKCLALQVLEPGTTNITAIGWQLAQALTTGFYLFFKDLGASYVQSAVGNQPAATGTNGGVPTGYTAMTTSVQNSWTGSVATSSTGVKGDYTALAFGVGNNYTGAGGTGVDLVATGNAYNLVYDEQRYVNPFKDSHLRADCGMLDYPF